MKLSRYKKIRNAILSFENALGGILVLIMLVVVFFATIGRYTAWYNMSWSDEASRYCLVWMGFILAGLSAYKGEMFSVDLFSEKLSPRGKKIFLLIRTAAVIGFCIFGIVYGINLVERQMQIGQISPSLKMPMWIMYSSVPLGCFLIGTHYTLSAVEQLLFMKKTVKVKIEE